MTRSFRPFLLTCTALACALGAGTRPALATPVHVHSLLELNATTRGTALISNWDSPEVSAFDPYSARVFAEATPTSHLEIDLQALYQENAGLRLIGAYLQYTPWPERDLHLTAGKIPWLIGTYNARVYSDRNPLIGTPLMYQFHAGVEWYSAYPTVDDLLTRTYGGDPGDGSVHYAGGMPVIWESWWDVGIMAVGSARPFEGALGVVCGTPGWASAGEEENNGKSYLGRIGVSPVPQVRVGVSGSIGPYLKDSAARFVPPGRSVNDYDQKLAMVDAELQFGHAELRGEAFRNLWETPTIGNLGVSGYYAEGKYTLPLGLYTAARWDILRFTKVTNSSAQTRPWHRNVNRLEVGLGCRLSRGVTAKLVHQRFTELAFDATSSDETFDLSALGLSISF